MQLDTGLCRMEGKISAEKREQSGGLTGGGREAFSHGERGREREGNFKPLCSISHKVLTDFCHNFSRFFSPLVMFSCGHLIGSLNVGLSL